jgi:hypothetical protein
MRRNPKECPTLGHATIRARQDITANATSSAIGPAFDGLYEEKARMGREGTCENAQSGWAVFSMQRVGMGGKPTRLDANRA